MTIQVENNWIRHGRLKSFVKDGLLVANCLIPSAQFLARRAIPALESPDHEVVVIGRDINL